MLVPLIHALSFKQSPPAPATYPFPLPFQTRPNRFQFIADLLNIEWEPPLSLFDQAFERIHRAFCTGQFELLPS